MTELFLQKDGGQWQRVYFDTSGGSIKLTRENPYFTQSESYTFDITLPMDILTNRQFFANLQRMDVSKGEVLMNCRLMVNSSQALYGTAKVVQVTQNSVKIQMLGGNCETNIKGSSVYIDEMDLGTTVFVPMPGVPNCNDAGIRLLFMQSYDETSDEVVNRKTAFRSSTDNPSDLVIHPLTDHLHGDAPQPALLDVVLRVIRLMGYTPGATFSPYQAPWKDIYIASAKKTTHVAHALPHWTAKEFLDEVCFLFNCTMTVDSVAKTISMESNITFYGSKTPVSLSPCDEYTAEVTDGKSSAQSLSNDDIAYALSSSAAHDYDALSEAIRNNTRRKEYASKQQMESAYVDMDAVQRRKYLFKCPLGLYTEWTLDVAASIEPLASAGTADTSQQKKRLIAVDMLAPLKRNDTDNDSMRKLKIVPVAITEEAKGVFVDVANGHPNVYDIEFRSLSLENPTGNELGTTDEEEAADIQDLITGEAETAATDNAEKEDLMQVFLFDDTDQPAIALMYDDGPNPDYKTFYARMPVTDYRYKVQGNGHPAWSLSLNSTDATYYIGQLHRNEFSFNMKARHVFRFIADRMPDPREVFIIRGKRFACEKIEASVNAEGFDKLMTGYFYEML